jgi:hypothetical protein
LIGITPPAKPEAYRRESGAQESQISRRKAITLWHKGRAAEDEGKVYNCMPGDRKRQLRLTFTWALQTRDDERARIQNRCKCPKLGLVIVLGTKKGEYRIGKMALEQLRGPELPVVEHLLKLLQSVVMAVSA